MRVGVFLQTCDLETGRAFCVDEVAERAREVETLGFDSVWVMDHLLMEGQPGVRATSHDPMVLLTAIALRTKRIQIGPLVMNGSPFFRHPAVLARQASSVQEISGGRLVLGIGAGWHQPEFEAHGIPSDYRASRFESTLEVLGPLLRSADTVVRATPPPPILVGGTGPRMLRLTARYASAWNRAFGGPDPGWYDESVKKLRDAMREEGRPESELELTVGISVIPVEGAELDWAYARRQLRDGLSARYCARDWTLWRRWRGSRHYSTLQHVRPRVGSDVSQPGRRGTGARPLNGLHATRRSRLIR